ncbi:lipoyltransferase [Acaromyces ingoldii]|uniref:lipoyl(octanoyl) transferase n=1 Tax=Acaromyces ingoldii TaxID=215250 RepID=A0A316YUD0_9BASI|nr:lipoyltransferase [Acaromyces ingoldii]PWN93047.1 lipoyltransferase [Acaromyces ingoldii]
MASMAAARGALGAVQWSHIPQLVPYPIGLALQEHLVHRRLAARSYLAQLPAAGPSSSASLAQRKAERVSREDILLLLEHTPTFTEGRRKGAKEAIADDDEGKRLRALGADYIVAQRGGLVTYHGPGQLVGYPIWDLQAMDLSTRCYVDRLQKAFHALLSAPQPYGIKTFPPYEDNTGVWTSPDHKIVSIGIQVRQRIASHGFALNVEALPLLRWFDHIVACGIEGKKMSAIERERSVKMRAEEEARPDREAASESGERLDDIEGGQARTQSAADRDRTTGPKGPGEAEARVYSDPVGCQIEPGLVLGPEARTTVASVVPHVVQHLGKTYGRHMAEATEELLRYEADEVTGRLKRAWVDGEEVVTV